jgi:predicted nucleotidyltransferase
MELPIAQIKEFCQRWQITEFALFGSVLRDDFRPDSDIDVLVTVVLFREEHRKKNKTE